MSFRVAIIIGSESDLEFANKCQETLKSLSIVSKIKVLSAHRTPVLLDNYINKAEEEGVKIFIAMAGLAAHLAGSIAAKTIKPVIGVPLEAGPLNGFDSLLSTVQMPRGIPVATVAVGNAGASNSAYLAAQILGLESSDITKTLKLIREQDSRTIMETNRGIKN